MVGGPKYSGFSGAAVGTVDGYSGGGSKSVGVTFSMYGTDNVQVWKGQSELVAGTTTLPKIDNGDRYSVRIRYDLHREGVGV